jgi:hypothetical protein
MSSKGELLNIVGCSAAYNCIEKSMKGRVSREIDQTTIGIKILDTRV